jgi:hypothetical protein
VASSPGDLEVSAPSSVSLPHESREELRLVLKEHAASILEEAERLAADPSRPAMITSIPDFVTTTTLTLGTGRFGRLTLPIS